MSEIPSTEHLMRTKATSNWQLSGEKINHLQQASMENLTHLAKHAHFVDVRIRINGEDRWFQVDWLKHLEKAP